MIPQEKLTAVTSAVREVFATDAIEDTQVLHKGQSGALVFRIILHGAPYLLRIVTRTEDPTLGDHFTCMKTAAEAGLAPRVLYTSTEDRIAITDFVKAVPFTMTEARARMPATLRAVHALPPFPRRVDFLNTSCTFLLNRDVANKGLISRIAAMNIFPKAELDELLARYEQILAAYTRRDSDQVSSHNDLFKPDNILFDGSRVWLVDWEAAFLNDRYAELAVVANMLVNSDEDEKNFLQDYLAAPAQEMQLARFYLMRQLAHIFYALAFTFVGSLGQPIDWSTPLPDFEELRHAVWSGAFNMEDRPSKITYGRVHLEKIKSLQLTRFDEALKIVAG